MVFFFFYERITKHAFQCDTRFVNTLSKKRRVVQSLHTIRRLFRFFVGPHDVINSVGSRRTIFSEFVSTKTQYESNNDGLSKSREKCTVRTQVTREHNRVRTSRRPDREDDMQSRKIPLKRSLVQNVLGIYFRA